PDGAYVGAASVALGDAPLYAGGPTSLRIAGAGGSATFPGASVPALTSLTVGCVYRPAAIGALRLLITRDRDSGGGRFWQWRMNSTSVEFIKITGGIQTVARAHGL